jgi:hypothetical protein
MHQQIRVVLASPSSVQDGPGAMSAVPVEFEPREVEPGALVRLLKLLADNGYNLRMAGGHGIEMGGEFVFAIDDKGDKSAAEKCAAFLRESPEYDSAHVVAPFTCEVKDEAGTLHDCLEKQLALEGGLIDELFVGTPRKDEGNKIPIQVTMIRTVTRRESERSKARRS